MMPRLLTLFLVLAFADIAAAQTYTREAIRIPMPQAGPDGLEALLVRPTGAGRFPLVLMSHGSPRSAAERPDMTPNRMLPQAMEFARRGWAVAIVMRRGFGDSGRRAFELIGPCDNPDHMRSARAAVADLRAAITHLARRADIDGERVLAVGQSAGGFASIALAADPPSGLRAAINFAGGRGSQRDDEVCSPQRLIAAFATFGATTRVPTLWIYSQNDRYFGPELAQAMHAAFVRAGGKAEFVSAPALPGDGHAFFRAAIPQWLPWVDAFLRANGLTLRANPLPLPPVPDIPPPASLGATGRTAFKEYLASAPHKAFALSPSGRFAWRSGARTPNDARTRALEACRERSPDCRIVYVDDAPAR